MVIALNTVQLFLAQAAGAILDPIPLVVMALASFWAPRWWVAIIPALALAAMEVAVKGGAERFAPAFLADLVFGLAVWMAGRWLRGRRSVAP